MPWLPVLLAPALVAVMAILPPAEQVTVALLLHPILPAPLPLVIVLVAVIPTPAATPVVETVPAIKTPWLVPPEPPTQPVTVVVPSVTLPPKVNKPVVPVVQLVIVLATSTPCEFDPVALLVPQTVIAELPVVVIAPVAVAISTPTLDPVAPANTVPPTWTAPVGDVPVEIVPPLKNTP